MNSCGPLGQYLGDQATLLFHTYHFVNQTAEIKAHHCFSLLRNQKRMDLPSVVLPACTSTSLCRARSRASRSLSTARCRDLAHGGHGDAPPKGAKGLTCVANVWNQSHWSCIKYIGLEPLLMFADVRYWASNQLLLQLLQVVLPALVQSCGLLVPLGLHLSDRLKRSMCHRSPFSWDIPNAVTWHPQWCGNRCSCLVSFLLFFLRDSLRALHQTKAALCFPTSSGEC